MNILDSEEGLDGHDQLAALMKADIHSPISETLEFALIELARGRVLFEGSRSRKVSEGRLRASATSTLLMFPIDPPPVPRWEAERP